jgi:hypothetical protein
MGEGFSIALQWEIHAAVTALVIWPLIRIFRRAGLSSWPVVFVIIPVFGTAIVGSVLAFKRWPLVPPRVAPKPARKTRTAKAS